MIIFSLCSVRFLLLNFLVAAKGSHRNWKAETGSANLPIQLSSRKWGPNPSGRYQRSGGLSMCGL